MAIIRWRPFDDLEKAFEHYSQDLAIDVYEEGSNIIAKMHVPGINPDDITVEVDDDCLHISGERECEKKIEDDNYYKREICYGAFERTIILPCSVDEDAITAECKDGILIITMPKSMENKKEERKIKVVKK